MKWFTSPQQELEWSTKTGDLPTRQSVQKLPGYAKYIAKYPGDAEFVPEPAATRPRCGR